MTHLPAPAWLAAIALLAVACPKDDPSTPDDTGSPDDTDSPQVDADGDGYLAGDDCDDENDAIHPGADERCNGVDDDCDGVVDEDDAVDAATWYTDADADGFGDPAHPVGACTAPAGTSADGTDCDDEDAAIHPGATDLPCTGVAEDCVADTGDSWVPTDHATLQAALDAAPDDAWICVEAGAYAPFVMSRPAHLAAIEGPDVTVIDGGDTAPLGLIDGADGALVRGFTFTRGAQTDRPAGLLVSGADDVTILGNRFVDIDGGTFCGGLVVSDSEGTRVEGNTFDGNQGEIGAAVALYLTGDATLVENVFTDNEAENGSGLLLLGAGAVTVEGGSFSGNVATDTGGAIAVNAADSLAISGTTFDDNHSLDAGGHLWATGLGTLTVTDSAFTAGSAGSDGGSLWLMGASLVDLDAVEVSGGTSAGIAGGMVLLDSGALSLAHTTWSGHQGGGITALYAELHDAFTDSGSTFDGTTPVGGDYQVLLALGGAGPATLDGTRWLGPAQGYSYAALIHAPGSITMRDVAVEGTAGLRLEVIAGLVDIVGFEGSGLGSGGLQIEAADEVQISDASLADGLVGLTVEGVAGDVRLTDIVATGNTSLGLGVSEVVGTVRIETPTLTANGYHGLVLTDAAAVLVSDAILQGNAVSGSHGGGGLFARDIASLILTGGDVSANTSEQPGGGLYVDSSYLVLSDTSIVHDNSPDQVACQGSSGCTAY
ncbi:MAG: MopE-related protein [Pseudomonadota bacterium]